MEDRSSLLLAIQRNGLMPFMLPRGLCYIYHIQSVRDKKELISRTKVWAAPSPFRLGPRSIARAERARATEPREAGLGPSGCDRCRGARGEGLLLSCGVA